MIASPPLIPNQIQNTTHFKLFPWAYISGWPPSHLNLIFINQAQDCFSNVSQRGISLELLTETDQEKNQEGLTSLKWTDRRKTSTYVVEPLYSKVEDAEQV